VGDANGAATVATSVPVFLKHEQDQHGVMLLGCDIAAQDDAEANAAAAGDDGQIAGLEF